MVSTMDVVPTILDWFCVPYPEYKLFGKPVTLTGKSILPAITKEPLPSPFNGVFASHSFHEVTLNYPMRVARHGDMKIIHNINHRYPYPLATDLYMNPTFLDILNRTIEHRPLPWFITLKEYYYRNEWQMYNISADPQEQKNLATDPKFESVFTIMAKILNKWLVDTNDPWRCLPHGELEGDTCYKLWNNGFEKFSLEDLTEEDTMGALKYSPHK